jgi:hypothetical protein
MSTGIRFKAGMGSIPQVYMALPISRGNKVEAGIIPVEQTFSHERRDVDRRRTGITAVVSSDCWVFPRQRKSAWAHDLLVAHRPERPFRPNFALF